MKKFIISIVAIQLLATDKSFAGQPVKHTKDKYEADDLVPCAILNINGEPVKIEVGQWIVEYPDGTKEIWSDEKIKADTSEVIEKEEEKEVIEKEENPQ